MKITIEITKEEKRHLLNDMFCELDACSTVIDIIKRIRRKLKNGKA